MNKDLMLMLCMVGSWVMYLVASIVFGGVIHLLWDMDEDDWPFTICISQALIALFALIAYIDHIWG